MHFSQREPRRLPGIPCLRNGDADEMFMARVSHRRGINPLNLDILWRLNGTYADSVNRDLQCSECLHWEFPGVMRAIGNQHDTGALLSLPCCIRLLDSTTDIGERVCRFEPFGLRFHTHHRVKSRAKGIDMHLKLVD